MDTRFSLISELFGGLSHRNSCSGPKKSCALMAFYNGKSSGFGRRRRARIGIETEEVLDRWPEDLQHLPEQPRETH